MSCIVCRRRVDTSAHALHYSTRTHALQIVSYVAALVHCVSLIAMQHFVLAIAVARARQNDHNSNAVPFAMQLYSLHLVTKVLYARYHSYDVLVYTRAASMPTNVTGHFSKIPGTYAALFGHGYQYVLLLDWDTYIDPMAAVPLPVLLTEFKRAGVFSQFELNGNSGVMAFKRQDNTQRARLQLLLRLSCRTTCMHAFAASVLAGSSILHTGRHHSAFRLLAHFRWFAPPQCPQRTICLELSHAANQIQTGLVFVMQASCTNGGSGD